MHFLFHNFLKISAGRIQTKQNIGSGQPPEIKSKLLKDRFEQLVFETKLNDPAQCRGIIFDNNCFLLSFYSSRIFFDTIFF